MFLERRREVDSRQTVVDLEQIAGYREGSAGHAGNGPRGQTKVHVIHCRKGSYSKLYSRRRRSFVVTVFYFRVFTQGPE